MDTLGPVLGPLGLKQDNRLFCQVAAHDSSLYLPSNQKQWAKRFSENTCIDEAAHPGGAAGSY